MSCVMDSGYGKCICALAYHARGILLCRCDVEAAVRVVGKVEHSVSEGLKRKDWVFVCSCGRDDGTEGPLYRGNDKNIYPRSELNSSLV